MKGKYQTYITTYDERRTERRNERRTERRNERRNERERVERGKERPGGGCWTCRKCSVGAEGLGAHGLWKSVRCPIGCPVVGFGRGSVLIRCYSSCAECDGPATVRREFARRCVANKGGDAQANGQLNHGAGEATRAHYSRKRISGTAQHGIDSATAAAAVANANANSTAKAKANANADAKPAHVSATDADA